MGEMGSTWRFEARPSPNARREETTARIVRIESALRAGASSPIRVEICLTGGDRLETLLVTSDPTTDRWMRRVLLPAYPIGSWSPGFTHRSRPSIDGWEARRVRPWPSELLAASDDHSTLDQVSRTLGTHRHPAQLTVSARPGPSASAAPAAPLGTEGRTPIRDLRTPPKLPGAKPGDAPEAPLLWWVSVRLELPPIVPPDEAPTLVEAVSLSFRSRSGNGLAFRRHRSLLAIPPRRTHEFLVTEGELARWFPRTEPVVSAAGGGRALGLPLGRSMAGQIVSAPLESEQGRHLAVLGESGMGKSSFLVASARRVAGRAGVVLLDPLGETAALARVELQRAGGKEPLWVAPTEPRAALNALGTARGVEPEEDPRAERRLNDLVHALRRVRAGRYSDSGFWGPRLEEMLLRSMRAAAGIPGATLEDAHTLLASGGRTRQVVPAPAMERVRELADRIRSRPDDADGARRLLYEVIRSDVLRRTLCARAPTLTGADLVEPGRVVLISGEARDVGEATARYFLSVYLALVWSEFLARTDRSKTFVLLDEVQWYAHGSLSEMLRLARRRNVHVVLATQGVGSLPEEVREAVWTNVADWLVFRGAPEEAREIGRITSSVTAEAVLRLPRGHAVALIGKGEAVEWLEAARLPSSRPRTETRPPEAPSGATDPISRETPPEPGEARTPDPEAIVEWLDSQVEATGAVGEFTIALDELRARFDPTGESVRRAGSLLGRSGRIERRFEEGLGTVWRVLPTPSAPKEIAEGRAPETSDAPPTQPS